MIVFIVPGYGIPDNILIDKTYTFYLNNVNQYISIFIKTHPKTKIVIIFTGGNSDLTPPYKRTEAFEMLKLYQKISKIDNKNIKYRLEQKSLSSLENQVYSKVIIDKYKNVNKVIMFGEKSRFTRLRKIGKLIFTNFKTVGIDIPMSKEQSENKKVIKKKEDLITKYSLWALKSKDNLKKFRKTFQNKFKYLRKFPKEKREEAIVLWWKKSILEAKI